MVKEGVEAISQRRLGEVQSSSSSSQGRGDYHYDGNRSGPDSSDNDNHEDDDHNHQNFFDQHTSSRKSKALVKDLNISFGTSNSSTPYAGSRSSACSGIASVGSSVSSRSSSYWSAPSDGRPSTGRKRKRGAANRLINLSTESQLFLVKVISIANIYPTLTMTR